MTVMEAPVVDIAEILLQWHGDEDTCGYQHAELVVAACELAKPMSALMTLGIFYPDPSDADEETREVLNRGWELYVARKNLRKRRGA